MTAALPAFLLEVVFYLGSVFEETRHWFQSIQPKWIQPRRLQGFALWFSALLPYLIFSISAGVWQRSAFQLLAVLTGVLCFWYILLPRRLVYDLGFLVIAAAPVVLRVFSRLYVSPEPHLRVGDALGHLMWIRLGIAALLIFRDWNPGAFGFWPKAHEWVAGTLWFAIAVVPLCLLALGIGMVQFAAVRGPWWQIAGVTAATFFGALWVVALSEEFFFRGVVERAFLNAWNSPTTAILISAALYGCSHFWYRGFPNWREAVVTMALGIPCGVVYLRTGSVRAPMITHAFAAATVRTFFRYT